MNNLNKNKMKNYKSIDNYQFPNNSYGMNNINKFPQEKPKFANPFLMYHNNMYPSFDNNNDYSKKNNYNNNNNNINYNNSNYNNNNNFNSNNSNNTNFNYNNNNNNNFQNNNNNYNNNYNNFNNNYNNNNNNNFNNNYNNNCNNNFNNNYNNNFNNNYNNNFNNNFNNNYNNNFNNNYNNNFNNNFNNNINQFNNFNNNYNNNNNSNNNNNNFGQNNNNIKNNINIQNNNSNINNQINNNLSDDFEIIKLENNFTEDLISTMSVLNTSKNTSWKDNLKSFVSTLFYNNHNFSDKLEKSSIKFPLYIFNKKIDNIIRDEIKYPLKSFLYMSYKSGFNNLSNIGCEDFTSDCGWGCMIRCCQMLLSKALIQKKIFDYFTFLKITLINNNTMNEIRNNILTLFNDNYLPLELIKENKEYKKFWELYGKFSLNNKRYNSIIRIIPPYSIHILSKFGNCAGVYTSDQRIIKVICDINSSIFSDLVFVHFTAGNISRKKLLSTFCEECTNLTDVDNLITYNGIDYKFKQSGVIFISLRLGLQNLDETYYDLIPLILKKIRHNFGIVGGRKNRAYYFIGVQNDNKLIFSDPHLNQEITGDIFKDNEKYYNENLDLMDVKEMCSGFSFAVGIFNKMHLIQFFEDISFFNNSQFKDCLYFEKD